LDLIHTLQDRYADRIESVGAATVIYPTQTDLSTDFDHMQEVQMALETLDISSVSAKECNGALNQFVAVTQTKIDTRKKSMEQVRAELSQQQISAEEISVFDMLVSLCK
jgi:hypothetical protein